MAASDKFARLAALRPVGRMNDAPTQTWHPDADPRMPDECALARLLGATVTRTKFGSHLSVRNWHATPEFCAPSSGVIRLLLGASSGNKRGAIGSPPQLAEDPEKWLFLDTETTGLAGGTGTYAFLIGIAWWDGGGLQVEQFLMRDFSEEHSVLVELAERIAERPVLVTFNGKTFDWPLLENRYVMTRNIRVPKLATHLDLLHPARAVWKLRLGSVRLVELEREVLDLQRLGWCREDDVPSSLIPQFYFDYLRGGAPAPLVGVVRHNLMDLRGLAALFGRLNSLLSMEEPVETKALDLLGLSRYLRRRGEPQRAESTCMAARNLGLPPPVDGQAQRELAFMAKRRGEHTTAAKIWEALLQDEDCRALACEELSIYYERRAKNLQRALEFARLGLRFLCGTGGGISSTMSRKVAGDLRRAEQLTKRLLRLKGRIAAAPSQRSEPLLQSRATADTRSG